MKNIDNLVNQKEREIAQLQKEIEALRVAARLLGAESDPRAESVDRFSGATSGPVARRSPASSVASVAALSASAKPAIPV